MGRGRKTSEVPSRIYTYGIVGVLEGQPLIDEQFRLARIYRNKLVEIEQARLTRIRALYDGRATIAPLLAREAKQVQDLAAARDAIKTAKVAKKLKQGLGPTTKMMEDTRQIEADLRKMRTSVKEARLASNHTKAIRRAGEILGHDKAQVKANLDLLHDGSVDTLLESLRSNEPGMEEIRKIISAGRHVIVETASAEADAHNARLMARADSGVFWGTYLLCEEEAEKSAADVAKKGKLPKFRRDLDGRLGVQFQKTDKKVGIPVAKLFEGKDDRMRFVPVDDRPLRPGSMAPDPNSHRSQLRRRLACWMRIQSDEKKHPLWGKFRIIMHRPLPEDGVVKRAWVRRTSIANRFRYELQITLESRAFETPKPEGKGTVAIDIGWRMMEEDTLRVAYLYDDKCVGEEIRLPDDVQAALNHADSLRAKRDDNFNAARIKLQAWLDESTAPDWLTEALATMAQWRSCRRLAKIIWGWYEKRDASSDRKLKGVRVPGWRERRFAGDEDVFAVVAEWEKQDRHLWTWEANERDKALARRLDFYRVTAKHIATTYAKILLEDFDLRRMAKHAKPEDEDQDNPQVQRRNRHQAALSEFRNALKLASQNYGAEIELRKAAFTTIKCHKCGSRSLWDAAPEVKHKCAKCGATWDQDENAGINLHKAPRAA